MLDGHGLKLLAHGGITPVVITGRDSPAVRRRVADLGIAHAVYGADDKLAGRRSDCARTWALRWTQIAAIGDDWPDLPLLRRAAFACAPANAHAEVKAVAHHVTHAVRRPRRGARVLRPAADGRRPLRGAAAGPVRQPRRAMNAAAAPPELHLPDLPEVEVSLGVHARRSRDATAGCGNAARDFVGAYLPLLLMGLLALGTWWLVKNTPRLEAPQKAAAVRREPDYTMRDFAVSASQPTAG